MFNNEFLNNIIDQFPDIKGVLVLKKSEKKGEIKKIFEDFKNANETQKNLVRKIGNVIISKGNFEKEELIVDMPKCKLFLIKCKNLPDYLFIFGSINYDLNIIAIKFFLEKMLY